MRDDGDELLCRLRPEAPGPTIVDELTRRAAGALRAARVVGPRATGILSCVAPGCGETERSGLIYLVEVDADGLRLPGAAAPPVARTTNLLAHYLAMHRPACTSRDLLLVSRLRADPVDPTIEELSGIGPEGRLHEGPPQLSYAPPSVAPAVWARRALWIDPQGTEVVRGVEMGTYRLAVSDPKEPEDYPGMITDYASLTAPTAEHVERGVALCARHQIEVVEVRLGRHGSYLIAKG